MLNAYRNRVQVIGDTARDNVQFSTKRQIVDYILNSPSLKYVCLNMQETLPIPSIITDIRTYRERKFLFLPELNINVGDYITYQNMTYLAIDKVFDDIYPQLQGIVCNVNFPIHTEELKTRVGEDAVGRPIYKTDVINVVKPAVMVDKIYSQANNSPIPLPDGAIIVKIPYSKEKNHTPKVNSIVSLDDNQYKVSLISDEFVINEVGFIEVQLQRIPKI